MRCSTCVTRTGLHLFQRRCHITLQWVGISALAYYVGVEITKSEAVQQTRVESRRLSSSPLQRRHVHNQVPSINSHRCHMGSQPRSNRSHCHSKSPINPLLFGFEWQPFRKRVVFKVHAATAQRTYYNILPFQWRASPLRWSRPQQIDRLGAREATLLSTRPHLGENRGLLLTQGEPQENCACTVG